MVRIKVGIVGTGGMANTHVRRYRQIRGVELFACYDVDNPRADDFAQRHQIGHVASSMDDVIDSCDAVSVVTPDAFHAALSIRTLEAGRHLLCEKPLTTTLAEARHVARAAVKAQRRQGTVHMVNFSYRNSSAIQEAIKIVDRGDLGEIRHVHGSYLQSWLTATMWGHWQDSHFLWRLQNSKGSMGVLGDVGCHLLDTITAVAGEVEAVDCVLSTFPKIDRKGRRRTSVGKQKLDANDTALIRLYFSNGVVGMAHTSRWATGHTNSISFSVHGTDGALRVDLDRGYDKLFLCQGKTIHNAEPRWRTRTIRATPDIHQRFIKSIKTGNQDQPDVVRGAQVQSYLDACQTSSEKNGAPIRIRKWL